MAKSQKLTRQTNFKRFRDELIPKYKDAITTALPKHLNPERFIRIALTGFTRTPELMDCTDPSILVCLIQAAQLGLELDGITGQAYLVPFKNNNTGQRECQLIPGYKGLLTLAYNSDKVDSVNAKTVHEGDSFQFNYGLNPDLIHIPKFDAKKRKISHVYCVVKMKTGGHVFDIMSKDEIEEHKKRYSHAAKKKDSVWEKEWEAMAKKTVIRRTLKLVPQSPDLRLAVTMDERAEVGMEQKLAPNFEIIDIEPEDQAEVLKQKLEAQKEKTAKRAAKTSSKSAKSSEKDKSDDQSGDITPKPSTTNTGKYKGNYEKDAIDRYNQLLLVGGDSPALLDQLTGNKRVDTSINDALKRRVIHMFDEEIAKAKDSTPKQETILPDQDLIE